jgi:hypothetical protein
MYTSGKVERFQVAYCPTENPEQKKDFPSGLQQAHVAHSGYGVEVIVSPFSNEIVAYGSYEEDWQREKEALVGLKHVFSFS